MKAEDLILDHCSQGQVIEKFCEALPDVSVSILAKALIVETITIIIKSQIVSILAIISTRLSMNVSSHSKNLKVS